MIIERGRVSRLRIRVMRSSVSVRMIIGLSSSFRSPFQRRKGSARRGRSEIVTHYTITELVIQKTLRSSRITRLQDYRLDLRKAKEKKSESAL